MRAGRTMTRAQSIWLSSKNFLSYGCLDHNAFTVAIAEWMGGEHPHVDPPIDHVYHVDDGLLTVGQLGNLLPDRIRTHLRRFRVRVHRIHGLRAAARRTVP